MAYALMRLILAALILCAGTAALPTTDLSRLLGTVTRVIDGDTIDIQLASGSIRVRLHGIDAPERGQPWGKEATAAMAKLLLNRKVELEPFEQDRYERLIARVFLAGREVNGELIQHGHAWAYRQYLTKADARYCSLEAAARDARKGLWSLKPGKQVPPWQWRKRKNRQHSSLLQPPGLTQESCISQIGVR